MEIKRYYLILAVVIGILCAPIPGEVGEGELPLHYDKSFLIDLTNPALEEIEQLCVVIVRRDTELNKDNLVREQLEAKVVQTLREAGIVTIPVTLRGSMYEGHKIPDIRIDIDTLKLEDSQQCVFRIQTALTRAVCLKEESVSLFKADVWETEPVMQVVPVQSMPDEVTDVILEQVEAFICAYRAANPQGVQPSDANDIATPAEVRAKPADRPVTIKYEYVASKNSKVFHKPNCRSAERISPKNLVGYSSREEAIDAGKRPCKRCKP